jgi:hypothetical protein
MIHGTMLDHVPLWLLYAATAAALYAASEIGYRVGCWHRARRAETDRAPTNAIMGSTLGLLAFILAFTFGMSSTRFDTRRQLVLEEASAILQTYQRAQFLPAEPREQSSALLREYVALRLGVPELRSMAEVAEVVERSDRIQDALWEQAQVMAAQPTAMLSAYLRSLSYLTDLQMKRMRAAMWNRIPATIEAMLFAMACLGLLTVGYGAGLADNRAALPTLLIVLAFSAVIVIIVDLERPRPTLFEISEEPMAAVARRIEALPSPGER